MMTGRKNESDERKPQEAPANKVEQQQPQADKAEDPQPPGVPPFKD